MRKWCGPLLVTLMVAIGAHLALAMAAPNLIMDIAVNKIEKSAQVHDSEQGSDMTSFTAMNRILHGERRTPKTREVVAPNPNMLFSAILYDVSKKPLLIESPVPTTYWSISFFADNTDNFFVMNDRQAKAERVKFLLVNTKENAPRIEGAHVVRAQSEKGVVLFRYLIKDEAHFKNIDKLRQTTEVKQLRFK